MNPFKINRSLLSLLLVVACLAMFLLPGCTSSSVDPATGQTTSQYDPIKTQQVKDALAPAVSSPIRRIIANNPAKRDAIASYMRATATPFCQIANTGNVDLNVLTMVLDQATAEFQAKIDPTAIDVKNTVLALFKIYYNERFKAELPADGWTRNIADVICKAIDQGLKDSGLPGTQ